MLNRTNTCSLACIGPNIANAYGNINSSNLHLLRITITGSMLQYKHARRTYNNKLLHSTANQTKQV